MVQMELLEMLVGLLLSLFDMFFYYRQKGEVVMRSENECIANFLHHIELTPTQEEMEKLKQNYEAYIENNELILKPPLHILNEQKKQEESSKKNRIMENVRNAKNIEELKSLIQQLID